MGFKPEPEMARSTHLLPFTEANWHRLPPQINEEKMETLTMTNPLNRAPNSTISRVSTLPRSSIRKHFTADKNGKFTDAKFAKLIHTLGHSRGTDILKQAQGFELGSAGLPALILYYAKNGLFCDARALWGELVNSSYKPGIEIVSAIMDAYAEIGEFDEIVKVVHESVSRGFVSESEIYSSAVSCFGEAGQLHMMEDMVKSMVSRGFKVDSLVGNAFVKYYAMFSSLDEMEAAYQRMKRSRILIEEEAIRAMAHAYTSEKNFYKLGEFLRDVGLGRRNTGNLLWNLLLLSYAANFKMKSLQREFLNMLEAGFKPDLTTFNVRALAFSRMCMFWDLHLSMRHMKHERVVPDLVTYGCIVDLYLERRLAKNLSFALDELDVGISPVVATDPVVFDVFGKGDFHSSSEVLLESTRGREWTYSKLVRMYLKKQYRRNQIFWNY